MKSSGVVTIHIQLYKNHTFHRSQTDRSPGGSGDCWPKLVSKFDIRLTGILLHLQLNLLSASFPGGQGVVSSDPSMSAGVPTRLFCHRFAHFPGAVATSYTILLCHVARMMCQLTLGTGPLVSHPLYPLPSLPSSHIAQILTA